MIIFSAVFVATVVLAIWQHRLIRNFGDCYSQPIPAWPDHKPLPKVAILLSLRGHDPFLSQCLRNLVRQDYPDFQIHIVIDSETDPASQAVDEARLEHGDVFHVSVLRRRLVSCSLKNSSILQGIECLPDDVEVVALVDADAIVPSNWLRSLILPLANPKVGCTSGIRWFAPDDSSLGSRIRCFWNLIAAPMIFASNIPWGGSMAIRRSVLEAGLADKWSRSFCDDAPTTDFLRSQGLMLAYAPDATVSNRERISVLSCIRFVNRQTLIYCLYNSKWPALVASTLAAGLVRIGHDVLIGYSLVTQDYWLAAALICCYPMVMLVTRFEGIRLDRIVRQRVQANGQNIVENPRLELFGYFCTELVCLASIFTAMMTRHVNWRGIQYRIRGAEDITMLEYRSYEQPLSERIAEEATLV